MESARAQIQFTFKYNNGDYNTVAQFINNKHDGCGNLVQQLNNLHDGFVDVDSSLTLNSENLKYVVVYTRDMVAMGEIIDYKKNRVFTKNMVFLHADPNELAESRNCRRSGRYAVTSMA